MFRIAEVDGDSESQPTHSLARDLHQHDVTCLAIYQRCNLVAATTQQILLAAPPALGGPPQRRSV